MAAYNKVPGSREALAEASDAGADQWGIALSNSAPSSTTFVAGTTDLATGGGYTQGGIDVTTTSSAEAGGVYKLVLTSPPTWAPTAGNNIGPFRYVLLVNKTQNQVDGYWDYGSSITLNGTAGDVFTATLNATDGVVQIS